jgi:hypothetical protein
MPPDRRSISRFGSERGPQTGPRQRRWGSSLRGLLLWAPTSISKQSRPSVTERARLQLEVAEVGEQQLQLKMKRSPSARPTWSRSGRNFVCDCVAVLFSCGSNGAEPRVDVHVARRATRARRIECPAIRRCAAPVHPDAGCNRRSISAVSLELRFCTQNLATRLPPSFTFGEFCRHPVISEAL